jgi:hypothetical protein
MYVNVKNEFLGPDMPEGVTRALWHGVYGRPYQILLCHVMLESGAHWSGLPIHAISTTSQFHSDHQDTMPWKCMGEDIDVVSMDYLEGLQVKTSVGDGRHTGIIIDWKDGYSRYQQENKPLSLIALDSGPYTLRPNNYCIYKDMHFTNESLLGQTKKYRRGEELYWEREEINWDNC